MKQQSYATTLLLLLLTVINPVESQVLPVTGWLEKVNLPVVGLTFNAKIDTGADSTSLNVEIIRKYSQGETEWIRFRLKNGEGKTAELNRPIVRYVKIKRKLAPSIKRPVVMLVICLGKVRRDVEVNLAKRKQFKYQMLIGRNYLAGTYLVDTAQTYLHPPRLCRE